MNCLINPYISFGSAPAWLTNYAINNIKPSLVFSFKNNKFSIANISKTLTNIGTYSRSQNNPVTSSATLVNASGFIENAIADVPRITYNPLTGAREGVFIEPAVTNSIRKSEDFSASDWANLTNASWSLDNAQVNPRGITGSYKLVESSASGTHSVYALTNTSGTCTHSVFLKAAGRTEVRLSIYNSTNGVYGYAIVNLLTGAITSSSGQNAQSQQYLNGWWRVSFSATPTAVKAERLNIELYNGGASSYTGDGTSGVYVFGAQTETNISIPSSYIFNNSVSGSASRSVDSFVNSDLTPWYASSGTLVVRYKALSTGTSNNRKMVSIDDGTTANSITLSLNDGATPTNGADIVSASTNIFSNIIGTYTRGDTSIIALAFKADVDKDIMAAANEVYGAFSTSASQPTTLSRLVIGNGAATNSNATAIIQDIIFYPTYFTPIDLLSLTSARSFADLDAV